MAARVFASPLARRIAASKGIDLSALAGTGPRGRIVKSDVENAKPGAAKPAAGAPAAAGGAGIPGVAPLPDARLLYPAGSYEEIPHDNMRKAIAKRLTSAKTLIPHYYLTIDCNLDALMAVREKMNAAAPKGKDKVPAYKLSVNDFIMKASAMALMKHPDVNASWTDTAILQAQGCRCRRRRGAGFRPDHADHLQGPDQGPGGDQQRSEDAGRPGQGQEAQAQPV